MISHGVVKFFLLCLNAGLAILYFMIVVFVFQAGDMVLYGILLTGEVFHLWLLLTYIHTVWHRPRHVRFSLDYFPVVDVFITVAGEPDDVIEETLRAAMRLDYPLYHVFLLNDGYVARKENWKEAEQVARRFGVICITRRTPGGAKAGNINHALQKTSSPFVAVLDVDHVPHTDFLSKSMGYFTDPKVAFVQSPQYYRNWEATYVAAAAWEQQSLFFGPICIGKNSTNSVFMCGTNMVLRRSVLLGVGGMCENNIAEDFMTSVAIHAQGWKSVYIPEVLAEGLAPEDFHSYCSQQFRWARGSLELILRPSLNPFFRRGLSWQQRFQYCASASYYLSGIFVAINAILPLIFFYAGLVPLKSPSMLLAAVFLPYIVITAYALQCSSGFSYTFRALAFSMGSWTLFCRAFFSALFRTKAHFVVTSKKRLSGNFVSHTIPHILYIVLVGVGILVAIVREGVTASVMDNTAWALFNISVFMPFIVASFPKTYVADFFLQNTLPASQEEIRRDPSRVISR